MKDKNISDIYINDDGFRIDLESWREKDIIDFAPRATTPGGSTVMSDLGLYQPLVQTNWQHGFGHHWYDDAQAYMYTTGNIDTRHDGLVMMMTQAVESDTDNNRKEGFICFNGALYSYGAAGIRKYNGSTWSSIYSAAAVNCAINSGSYLLFCPDNLRVQKMDTGENISDAGLDSESTDYRWMIIHNGYIYAGKDETNRIHYDSNEDLSQLQGNVEDPNAINCGIGNIPTKKAIEFAGNLYVARDDGLWWLDDSHIARNVIDLTGESSSLNFLGMAIVNGNLVFSVRDKIRQWNGARIASITPSRVTDTFPYTTYGRFKGFISAGDDFLFCIGRTNEAIYSEALLCWDGVGWHKLMDIITDGTGAVASLGYDVVNNRLWYHLNLDNDKTYYVQLQDGSISFPHANFPTSGTHSLVTSRIDMGFRRVKKSIPSMLIETRNLSSSRYINVYYRLDNDTLWTLWDRVTENGIIELINPGTNPTIEFNHIILRFDFITGDTTQSPILEGYTLRFIMRPNVLWGYSFYVIAADSIQEDMNESDQTAVDVRDKLLEARDSKKPIALIDMFGIEHIGYLTSVQGQTVFRSDGESGEPDSLELRYLCNFASIKEQDAE